MTGIRKPYQPPPEVQRARLQEIADEMNLTRAMLTSQSTHRAEQIARREFVKRAHAEGVSHYQIAKFMNRARCTITNIAHDNKINEPTNRRLSEATVWNIVHECLRRTGTTLEIVQGRGPKDQEKRREFMVAAYRSGLTVYKICEITKRHWTTVYHILRTADAYE